MHNCGFSNQDLNLMDIFLYSHYCNHGCCRSSCIANFFYILQKISNTTSSHCMHHARLQLLMTIILSEIFHTPTAGVLTLLRFVTWPIGRFDFYFYCAHRASTWLQPTIVLMHPNENIKKRQQTHPMVLGNPPALNVPQLFPSISSLFGLFYACANERIV
jgi:hypothetical protein